jgi:hypothetical protein
MVCTLIATKLPIEKIAFSIAGGLAWFGFLAVGSLGEQVKTRLEVAREEADAQDVTGEVVELESGVSFQDLRVGGGRQPQKRDLVVLDFRCSLHTSMNLLSAEKEGPTPHHTELKCMLTSQPDCLRLNREVFRMEVNGRQNGHIGWPAQHCAQSPNSHLAGLWFKSDAFTMYVNGHVIRSSREYLCAQSNI